MTHSGIEGIDGDGTSANEDLMGLEIRDTDIGPELQNLRPTKARQHHGSTAGDETPEPYIEVVIGVGD